MNVADAADSAEDAVAAEDVAEVNAVAAGIIAVGAVVIRVDADTGVVDVANNSDALNVADAAGFVDPGRS